MTLQLSHALTIKALVIRQRLLFTVFVLLVIIVLKVTRVLKYAH